MEYWGKRLLVCHYRSTDSQKISWRRLDFQGLYYEHLLWRKYWIQHFRTSLLLYWSYLFCHFSLWEIPLAMILIILIILIYKYCVSNWNKIKQDIIYFWHISVCLWYQFMDIDWLNALPYPKFYNSIRWKVGFLCISFLLCIRCCRLILLKYAFFRPKSLNQWTKW